MKLKLLLLSIFLAGMIVGCQQNSDFSGSVTLKDEEGKIVVKETDLQKASLNERDGQLLVDVTFKDQDQAKKLTTEHLNEVINVYMGDTLLTSPKVQFVIDRKSIEFSGDFTKKEANQFISIVNQ